MGHARSVPLYEYVCGACSHAFEELVRNGDEPRCPACRSADLRRVLSVVSVGKGAAESSPAPSACGTCGDPRGPGACSLD